MEWLVAGILWLLGFLAIMLLSRELVRLEDKIVRLEDAVGSVRTELLCRIKEAVRMSPRDD